MFYANFKSMMPTCESEDWAEEKYLKLIREYRARPILWDQRNRCFFKKNLKPSAWQDIGTALDASGEQCRHKMLILTSLFRREKAKLLHSSRKDPPQPYKSTWFAFKEMEFLLDEELGKKYNSNKSDVSTEDEEKAHDIKLQQQHHLDSPIVDRKRPRHAKSVKDELMERFLQSDKEYTYMVQSPVQSSVPSQRVEVVQEKHDEIKSFTKFVANKMKRYSDATKNAVQQAICDVIFKADQNYYENCVRKFPYEEVSDCVNKQRCVTDKTVITLEHKSDFVLS